MTIEQALLSYNSKLVNEILGNKDFQSATASGNFARFINTAGSYTIENSGDVTTFVKFGTPYTDALDSGTPPGTYTGLQADIYEWLKYKKYGLEYKNDRRRQGLAGAIARKIERVGSLKHREPSARTTIIADALKASQPTLFDLLNKAHIEQMQARITQTLK